MSLWQASLQRRRHIETITIFHVSLRLFIFIKLHQQSEGRRQKSGTNLKSSRVSWIMFWMKWICREVSGAAPACPTTSAMFWESEEETAADRAAPERSEHLLETLFIPWPPIMWLILVSFDLQSGFSCCSMVILKLKSLTSTWSRKIKKSNQPWANLICSIKNMC